MGICGKGPCVWMVTCLCFDRSKVSEGLPALGVWTGCDYSYVNACQTFNKASMERYVIAFKYWLLNFSVQTFPMLFIATVMWKLKRKKKANKTIQSLEEWGLMVSWTGALGKRGSRSKKTAIHVLIKDFDFYANRVAQTSFVYSSKTVFSHINILCLS